eukprot:scaffold4150_cov117-Cylindrotheca_fusiformis.AAC.5
MATESTKGEGKKSDETTTTTATTTSKNKRPLDDQIEELLLPSLYRLTEGLPRRELHLMIAEAKTCEEALEREIKQLEQEARNEENNSNTDPKAAEGEKDNKELKSFVDMMLASEVTPADSFFTISALLGRLRDELAMPLPPGSSLPAHRAQVGLLQPPPKKKKKEAANSSTTASDASKKQTKDSSSTTAEIVTSSATLEKQKRILALQQNPEYTKQHVNNANLLALWKKISNHRASIVFRRPVNPKEAPGYTDRISFPMDLSMVRKMIVGSRIINSYADLHQRIGLICHNCMKYNGRESDYGVVTREFEANAEEFILQAVAAATNANAAAGQKDGTTTAAAADSKKEDTKKIADVAKEQKGTNNSPALNTSNKAATAAADSSKSGDVSPKVQIKETANQETNADTTRSQDAAAAATSDAKATK